MTRTTIWLSYVSISALAGLATMAPLSAAEWPSVRASDTLWPTTPLGDAQWPNIPADELAKLPAAAPEAPPSTASASPADANPTSAVPANTTNEKGPTFLDGILSRLGVGAFAAATAASTPAASAPPKEAHDKNDELTTGSLGGPRPAPASFVGRLAPDFAFEGGARYWYSIGQNRFAFFNGHPTAGNPTSTLDWDRMQGHSGELFGRVDHRPTHLFVKGLVGGGILKGGDMDDLDFFVTQFNFSNTTSAIDGNNLGYAMIDLGYSFEVPSEGIRFGAFVGYHYWHEKMTASGILCNPDDTNNAFCGPAGAVKVPFSTPVDIFDTTWNAIRVGGEARIQLYDRWSISGEVAFVPYAWMSNDDSHLLRQDLGPVPNILTRARNGMGAEAEAFVNYKVLPHFELGVGVRYWGLFVNTGNVEFGPTFTPDLDLTKFSTQRYGVLLQAKGSF